MNTGDWTYGISVKKLLETIKGKFCITQFFSVISFLKLETVTYHHCTVYQILYSTRTKQDEQPETHPYQNAKAKTKLFPNPIHDVNKSLDTAPLIHWQESFSARCIKNMLISTLMMVIIITDYADITDHSEEMSSLMMNY